MFRAPAIYISLYKVRKYRGNSANENWAWYDVLTILAHNNQSVELEMNTNNT